MNVLLETDRLLLRRLTDADADDLYDLDNDPEVMRFLNGGTFTPREIIVETLLPRFLAASERSARFGYWAAIEKATGAFLGWFSLRPHGECDPNEIELGYRLRRAAWGKGYGTEGARAVIEMGFAALGVGRVVATTYEDNFGSRRVMEKAGMALTRRFRPELSDLMDGGSYYVAAHLVFDGNDVEYELRRDEWERFKSSATADRSFGKDASVSSPGDGSCG